MNNKCEDCAFACKVSNKETICVSDKSGKQNDKINSEDKSCKAFIKKHITKK